MLRRTVAFVALAVTAALALAVPAAAVDGGAVVAFGGAADHGSTRTAALSDRVVGLVPTPTGGGYWQVAADGGVHSFGDAGFFGSTGAMRLARPVVGMAATPSGRGYWLVASDGGIFSFGDARFLGSTGAMRLARPITQMAATPSGGGYWLVAQDGGVFTFGDATFLGSGADAGLSEPVVSVAATARGRGYWLAAADGRVLAFGDAPDHGSLAAACKDQPVVAIAPRRSGGYWLGTSTFLPAAHAPGAHPLDVVAEESANLASLLRIHQGCQGTSAPAPGRLSSPLPGARVTSGYGWRTHPIYGRRQFHGGIDLAGGSAILAAGDGRVIEVRGRQGYGLTTVVDHGDGIGTVYAHQARVAVAVGQTVRRGQTIGTVGSTGFATGPHLHVEVRVKGEPTDPRRWF
jgi:hypothetical protein